MRLEETSEAQAWLTQFDVVDREVARQLLRKLTLVSQSEFESNLQLSLEDVLARIGKENVALLSITEPPNPHDPEGIRRTPGSSADRVKHLIENCVRVHGDKVRANPTVQSMRADRIKNIVLVEDFVGSGDRITGFWQTNVSRSVKSWVSFGWTKVWVVAYAALETGRMAMRRAIPVPPDRVVTVLPRADKRLSLTGPMEFLAEKYGRKLRGDMWPGYSGGGGAVVFQHGCPNNAPAILWAKAKGFMPLFPNRGIPTGLQGCFGTFDALASAETLWTFKQYKMALALIDDIQRKRAEGGEWRMAIALGLASGFGRWDDVKLRSQMLLTVSEIEQLRLIAYRMRLIDVQDHKLTVFGRDLLDRLKQNKRKRKGVTPEPLPTLEQLYYPDSCGGVARS